GGAAARAALRGEPYRTAPARILFVGIFRTEEAGGCAFTRALGGGAPLAGLGVPIQEIAVGPLRAEDASALAERLLDPSAGDVVGRAGAVARESAGSPFFVAELVRHLEAAPPSRGRRSTGCWHGGGAGCPPGGGAPPRSWAGGGGRPAPARVQAAAAVPTAAP